LGTSRAGRAGQAAPGLTPARASYTDRPGESRSRARCSACSARPSPRADATSRPGRPSNKPPVPGAAGGAWSEPAERDSRSGRSPVVRCGKGILIRPRAKGLGRAWREGRCTCRPAQGERMDCSASRAQSPGSSTSRRCPTPVAGDHVCHSSDCVAGPGSQTSRYCAGRGRWARSSRR
jgi:hypothetical protein